MLNLKISKLKKLARGKNIDGCQICLQWQLQDPLIMPFVPKPTFRHMPGAPPKLPFMLCTPTDTRTYDHTCERRSPTPMPRPKVTPVAGSSSTPMQRLRLTPVRQYRHTPLNMHESETKTTTNQNKIASAFKDEYNEY